MPSGALLGTATNVPIPSAIKATFSGGHRAVGVELSASGLQTVILERAGSRLQLVAAHETSCEASNAESVTRALTEVRQALRLTTPVMLGVPSTTAILTTVHPLVATPQRAGLAIQFELQQQLPFELAAAAWDSRWRAPRSSGVIAAAMRQSLLDERLACCRRAGLSVQAVTVNPVAALNALHAGQASQGSGTSWGTVLRLLTAQTAEWIVASPTLLHVIPVTSSSPETFWPDVAASWQALRTQDAEAPTPVRLIGSSDELPRAQEALAGVPVERVDPARLVAPGTVTLEHPERAVAALGLALQGLGAVPLPLNLLSGRQREERERKVRRISTIASGVCLAAAVGFGLSGMLEVRARRLSVQRALEQRERLYQTLRPEVRALIQRQQETERRSLRLEQLFGEAPVLTRQVGQIAEVLPREAWLTRLECSKSDGLLGLVEGRATSFQDVTKFLEALKGIAGMPTVKPLATNVVSDEATGRETIAFSVELQRPRQPPAPGGP